MDEWKLVIMPGGADEAPLASSQEEQPGIASRREASIQ